MIEKIIIAHACSLLSVRGHLPSCSCTPHAGKHLHSAFVCFSPFTFNKGQRRQMINSCTWFALREWNAAIFWLSCTLRKIMNTTFLCKRTISPVKLVLMVALSDTTWCKCKRPSSQLRIDLGLSKAYSHAWYPIAHCHYELGGLVAYTQDPGPRGIRGVSAFSFESFEIWGVWVWVYDTWKFQQPSLALSYTVKWEQYRFAGVVPINLHRIYPNAPSSKAPLCHVPLPLSQLSVGVNKSVIHIHIQECCQWYNSIMLLIQVD